MSLSNRAPSAFEMETTTRSHQETKSPAHASASTNTDTHTNTSSKFLYWTMATLNVSALSVGTTAGPLISRMYFANGGSKIWFSAVLQTVGFPLAFPILVYMFLKKPLKRHHVDTRLALVSAGVGLLTGIDVYIYSWGLSYLPVSTSQVLISTQLGFTAIFAFLLVRQKFTAYSINSIMLLTLSSVILAFASGSDKPDGVSHSQYVLGFVLTLGAAAMYGLIIPLVDFSYTLGKRDVTYTVMMEMQTIMSALATVVLAAGTLISGEYRELVEEASAFKGGVGIYVMCCVWTAVCWELYYIGIYGVTFQVNSLLSGIVIAAWIPATEVLAVVFFSESFGVEKGLSVATGLWGVTSYLFGEYKESAKKSAARNEPDPLPLPLTP